MLTRQSREDPTPHAYPEERREEILCAYQERSSLRGLERTDCAFRVRRSWLGSKKVARLPPLSETLLAPDPTDPASMTLELDELWSFVAKKTNQSWIWIALCRRSRQVVAYAIGDRSEDTCRRLWNAIPAAYQAVVPEEQHTTVGKETGQTAHVERWNNTLRQRLARFVRKTLSFSKSTMLHEACLLLFLHRYNLDRAIILM